MPHKVRKSTQFISFIRNKFHPLFQLRQASFYPILAKLLDHSVFVRIPNVSFPVSVKLLRDFSWVIRTDNAEPETCQMFKKLNTIFKPGIFFDIGANIGFYTWFLYSLNNQMKCYCFEPDPTNLKLIQKTIKRNRIRGVSIINSAVSNINGSGDFYQDKLSGATGNLVSISSVSEPWTIQYAYNSKEKISVNTITLDGYIANDGFIPDLVKIDAEGAEKLIVDGAIKLISNSNTIFLIECCRDREYIFNLFTKMNYRIMNVCKFFNKDFEDPNYLFVPEHLAGKISGFGENRV